MKRLSLLFLSTLGLFNLGACHVPLKSYRLLNPSVEIAPSLDNASFSAQQQVMKVADKNARPDVGCKSPVPICLAFIEFDDMGELWDKSELNNALRIIRMANDAAKGDKDHSPLVLTFIHGWKHNAEPSDQNVAGFKVTLRDVYQSLNGVRPVIGIYLGWRGNLIKAALPVAQQFSYYNREAAATRIPGAALASTITRISAQTHANSPYSTAIFVGHSFGGLALERSISEATASEVATHRIETAEVPQQEPKPCQPGSSAPATASPPNSLVDSRADLVIFINPAGAATESMQFFDFLTAERLRYQPLGDGCDHPLFVSLTSTADLATKVALPIGHYLPYLRYKNDGSFRDMASNKPSSPPNYQIECFDPHASDKTRFLKTKEEGGVSQGSFYLSSTPHMQLLQSHEMLKSISSNQMQVASTLEKINVDPAAISSCSVEAFRQSPGTKDVVSTFLLADTKKCFAIRERPNRCNGTPYWVMEIDPEVVPDHGTIFTQRFVQFIIDTYFAPNRTPLTRATPALF